MFLTRSVLNRHLGKHKCHRKLSLLKKLVKTNYVQINKSNVTMSCFSMIEYMMCALVQIQTVPLLFPGLHSE